MQRDQYEERCDQAKQTNKPTHAFRPIDGQPLKHSLSASFHPGHQSPGGPAKKGQVFRQEGETDWQHPKSYNGKEAEQTASDQEEGNRNAHDARRRGLGFPAP